jgi:hypothetical protein
MKLQYGSPTVVKIGPVAEMTVGGWTPDVPEILTKRAKSN